MKRAIAFYLLLCSPTAFAQQINPTVIFQRDTIILQNTDAYYWPFRPPSSTDTRENLCNIAEELRDPNGVPRLYPYQYNPIVHDTILKDLRPCDTCAPLGDTTVWMRLFQAARKPDGTKTDIIAKNVTISKNEDVDFRASGGVRLLSGFHAMPGSFFHAYTEPKWEYGDCATAGDSGNSLLFCDEFDHTNPQWPKMKGYWGSQCDKDSNVLSNFSDTEALDGKSLKITMKWDSTCECNSMDWITYRQGRTCIDTLTGCDIVETRVGDSCLTIGHDTLEFSSGQLLSCPWPFKSVASLPDYPVSQKLPYGKYEMRQKFPHGLFYHVNTYADDALNAWCMGETENTDTFHILPGIAHRNQYGPFRGKFLKLGSDTVLRSSSASFSYANNPLRLLIDGFPYSCQLIIKVPPDTRDTFLTFFGNTQLKGGISPALFNADSVTFYYERVGENVTASLPWSVDSTGHYFTGPFDINWRGDSVRFSKSDQPNQIILFPYSGLGKSNCRWDSASGKLWLETPLDFSAPRNNVGSFTFTRNEQCQYPQPFLYNHSGEYHTYTMEFLPHEWRFLVDGAVVRREPDRLIPRNDKRHDFVSDFPRMLTPINFGEYDIDGSLRVAERGADSDYQKRKNDFKTRYGITASEYIDYFKVWDLPSDYSVARFPY
jgi:hypothetical protein